MLTYRFAAVNGALTQILFGFFQIFIIMSFQGNNNSNAPMNITSMITYVWMIQAFFSMMPLNVNQEEMNMIYTGNIAYEMSRPVNLYSLWYAKTLGWRIGVSCLRAVPVFIFTNLILKLFGFSQYSIILPDIQHLMLFICSICLAYLLSCAITVLMYSITLFTIKATHFINMLGLLVYVFSGLIVPLSYFPDTIRFIINLQPYKSILDTPCMIFNSSYSIKEGVLYICLQITWIFAIILLTRFLMSIGCKKLQVQGG